MNQERKRLYEEIKQSAPLLVECSMCHFKGSPKHMDPHHVKGRVGANLFEFVWLHRDCHTFIHNNPAIARKNGLMTYTYDTERRTHEFFRLLCGGKAALED